MWRRSSGGDHAAGGAVELDLDGPGGLAPARLERHAQRQDYDLQKPSLASLRAHAAATAVRVTGSRCVGMGV
jgi:hypothetical protein